jgi:hypothetical protein
MIREVRFRRGTLTTRNALQETRTYTIRNVDQKAKILVLEHPVRSEYKLLNLKPAETTAARYRFEIKLAPSATEKFAVTEEKLFEVAYAVASMTPDDLVVYVRNKSLSDAARTQLERIVRQKQLIAEASGAAGRTEKEISDVVRDQDRIRQNILSLNNVSGQQEQVQKYAQQLARQETQLAALRDRLSELRKKKVALETELSALIDKVEF